MSKLAGAVGLLVGLAWLPWLGLAAGIGLTVFFIGDVIAHVRAGIYHNIAFPACTYCLRPAQLPTWPTRSDHDLRPRLSDCVRTAVGSSSGP
ncbi:DoxX family protein [Streptomyces sp. NPDC001743]|uniref:DoxX family protein n=1 Tax=Streptomyces sp. NPDC001743 TaxID=3154397 RepID=UPI0033309999